MKIVVGMWLLIFVEVVMKLVPHLYVVTMQCLKLNCLLLLLTINPEIKY